MTISYTTEPKPRSAKRAWQYFCINYGKPPKEMFFSPQADFYDTRGPGWTAYYGQEMYTSTWGAMCRDIFYVVEKEIIDHVLSKEGL